MNANNTEYPTEQAPLVTDSEIPANVNENEKPAHSQRRRFRRREGPLEAPESNDLDVSDQRPSVTEYNKQDTETEQTIKYPQRRVMMSEDENSYNNRENTNSKEIHSIDDDGLTSWMSCSACLKLDFFFRLGYKMSNYSRNKGYPIYFDKNNLAMDTRGLSVGVLIKQLQSYGQHIVGIVKPIVKVHLVSMKTGKHIRSKRNGTMRMEKSTSPCLMKDSSTIPTWEEELVLPSKYSEVADLDSLLLFEVLDYRPSLNSGSSRASAAEYDGLSVKIPLKKVAWGYLVPVGSRGGLNIGFSPEWRDVCRAHSDENDSLSMKSGGSNLSKIWRKNRNNETDRSVSDQPAEGNKETPINNTEKQSSGEKDLDNLNEGDPTSANTPTATEEEAAAATEAAVKAEREAMVAKYRRVIEERERVMREIRKSDVGLRLQLHSYRDYDGLIGYLQRKHLGWPGLNTHAYTCDDDAEEMTRLQQQQKEQQKHKHRQKSDVKNTPEEDAPNAEESTKHLDEIPSVYLQWRLRQWKPIKGAFLSVSVGPRKKWSKGPEEDLDDPMDEVEEEEASKRSVNDEMQDLGGSGGIWRRGRVFTPVIPPSRTRAEVARLRGAVQSRTRHLLKEECLVPDKFTSKIEVGPEGAMVVSFCKSGHVLAVAGRSEIPHDSQLQSRDGDIYALRLYNTDLNIPLWGDWAAHQAVIYDIQWSHDDQYLMTCSGDGTCKIWNCPFLLAFNKTFNSTQLDFSSTVADWQAMVDLSHSGNSIASNFGINSTIPGEKQLYVQWILRLANAYPPQLLHVLSNDTPSHCYCSIFQELPAQVSSSRRMTRARNALALEEEGLGGTEGVSSVNPLPVPKVSVPRVIVGSSDGKIRVWDQGTFMGFISVGDGKPPLKAKSVRGLNDFPPHNGQVNSVVIDERSKYLLSGDSTGDILAWRTDNTGWFQLLRKFKRDFNSGPAGGPGGILSLTMHPDRNKGLMVALQRQPAQLKVLNMTTYRTQCYCQDFEGVQPATAFSKGLKTRVTSATAVLHRAQVSADGQYVVCGEKRKANSNGSKDHAYHLKVWKTVTGEEVETVLSGFHFPYPIRSISWHPRQHLFAISMVGPGAAVVLYSANSDNSLINPDTNNNDNRSVRGGNLTARSSVLLNSSPGFKGFFRESQELDTLHEENSLIEEAEQPTATDPDKSEKAKRILAKIRAAKASSKEKSEVAET